MSEKKKHLHQVKRSCVSANSYQSQMYIKTDTPNKHSLTKNYFFLREIFMSLVSRTGGNCANVTFIQKSAL